MKHLFLVSLILLAACGTPKTTPVTSYHDDDGSDRLSTVSTQPSEPTQVRVPIEPTPRPSRSLP